MREIVLDTETTGIDALRGDRLVEIGCVELVNLIPTGESYHTYLNPERSVSAGALAVHGLTDHFLATKPRFAEIAEAFLDFIGDARLVIHNASFDKGFIDMELERIGVPALRQDRILDTLALARRKHPGQQNSLDALCSRYGVDNARRTRHGALLDAELLSEVYAELSGGRQAGLALTHVEARRHPTGRAAPADASRPAPARIVLSEEERTAHRAYVAQLPARPIWQDYDSADTVRPASVPASGPRRPSG